MSNFLRRAETAALQYAQEGMLHMIGAVPTGIGTAKGVSGYVKNWDLGSVRIGMDRSVAAGSALGGAFTGMIGGAGLGVVSDDVDVMPAMATGAAMGALMQFQMKAVEPSMAGLAEKGLGAWAGPGFSLLSSGYFMYKGYQDEGAKGLKDAFIFDIATNAALNKFHYRAARLANGKYLPETGIGASKAAIVARGGTLSMMSRFAGAGIGASIGQAVGDSIGLPGASIAGTFVGAYIGAAPMQFVASHPVLAIGGLAAAGVATAGYGAYEVVKMGYARRQNQRSIQTSGDLSSFMTTGANTMRARSVQAIQKSHMNARSALGQEANFMHFPNKNYFSNYRMG
jgi:hypothetical protein